MTEGDWLKCDDPEPMLRFLVEQGASERKLRLLACACCRRIWDLLHDPRSREAVEVAERFADDRATFKELVRARMYAAGAAKKVGEPDQQGWAAYWTANKNASGPLWNVFAAAIKTGPEPGRANQADLAVQLAAAEVRKQALLIHEVIGNPFQRHDLSEHCLAWEDGLVRRFAEAIYEDRAFERMPVLGDVLEDAGCTDEEVLRHCRERAEHVRGCWVLDLVLGLG
jgi:hypothetical protein